ncbi:hypothetical protein HB776_17440 [Tardiphaga robiniae]|uniref:Uncharacterized protein n=1 Tax=Tardiphaga robiniae TaxID=943830 RepID=A0A7G6U914_9BRAD|nr:hypothetical protein HB776_17440 [Tardiphaga robiniae]
MAARTINPPIEELRKVPQLVFAAGGAQKVPIIRGALTAGSARS